MGGKGELDHSRRKRGRDWEGWGRRGWRVVRVELLGYVRLLLRARPAIGSHLLSRREAEKREK